ncbi:hypothetical protein [Halorhabdus sp. BNX81]|uniref:hypothetical protein n=1 Tax=Halorhabdus sp. BNX81 TaxID=2980181 RepID=UPI0023DD1B95|nr:hypothetical protein [Halorhabdus sp. BNX81]
MPEPEWSRIGTTTVKDTVSAELDNGEIKEAGKVDLFVEMWEVKNDSRDGENYIACTPRAGIYPGTTYAAGWDGTENNETTITQDWDDNESGGYEITDWGPTTPKTGSLDWSMSASYTPGGVQGGVSASYDVPHIAREIESVPNETVAHTYTYPSSPFQLLDKEGKNQFVELENMGERWIKNAEDDEKMLSVSLFHEFYNRYSPADYWNYTDLPVYPTFETSVSCERNHL